MTAELEKLRGLDLFSRVDSRDLARMAAAGRWPRATRGEVLFREGSPARQACLLVTGGARLTKLNPGGEQVVFAILGPGRVLGCDAIVGLPRYFVSAVATGATEAIVWEAPALVEVMQSVPELAINQMAQLIGDLTESWSRYRALATQPVESRIAQTLLNLAQHFGRPVDDGMLVDLYLTREDLAQMIGSTLQTVSRTIARWADEELVRNAPARRLVIIRPKVLREIAARP